MSEDKKLSGNDYLKKCDEGLNTFQENLSNAIRAYEADNDMKSEFFALVLANEYKRLINRMNKFVSAMGSDDDTKDGEDDDGEEAA